MNWLVLAVVIAFVNAVVAEVLDWFPLLAEKVVRAAASRFPPGQRERYEAEWLAELEAVSGLRISKFLYALSLAVGSRKLRRQFARAVSPPRRKRASLGKINFPTLFRYVGLLATVVLVGFSIAGYFTQVAPGFVAAVGMLLYKTVHNLNRTVPRAESDLRHARR